MVRMGMAVFMIVAALVVAVLVLTPLLLAAVRVARRRISDERAPLRQAEAVVVGKRSQITGGGRTPADQDYFVTFQFPDGQRLELKVSGRVSGVLVPGDEGNLQWQGSRYLDFAREILR